MPRPVAGTTMLREMNDDPLRIIAAQHGVFLYREALEAGYSKSTITRMHRSGTWHRVRHGAYCFGDEWAVLDAVGRHLVLARAVRRTTPGVIAFSHTTALLLHGVDVWGAALGRVHVTRVDDGAHRSERDVVHHVGECTPDEVVAVRGLPTVNVTRAVLEHAALVPTESGLVSANSALHLGLTTPRDLRTCRDRFQHWPGAQRWHVVLHHMDGRAESVGETRSLHLFWRQGLPRPDLQRAVADASGHAFAFTDFAWDEFSLFGEFDGRGKFLRGLRPGETSGDVVFREKRREDKIRRLTGWRFVRLAWADLAAPARTAALIRAMMRDAA